MDRTSVHFLTRILRAWEFASYAPTETTLAKARTAQDAVDLVFRCTVLWEDQIVGEARPNFLDPLKDAGLIVRQADIRLQEISEALEMTGNNRLAQRLRYLSQDLEKARELIDAGSTAALDTLLTDAATASNNMIRAALAVAEARGNAVTPANTQAPEKTGGGA